MDRMPVFLFLFLCASVIAISLIIRITKCILKRIADNLDIDTKIRMARDDIAFLEEAAKTPHAQKETLAEKLDEAKKTVVIRLDKLIEEKAIKERELENESE